jgi:hypothetical protein
VNSRAGQRNYSGLFWCATTQTHLRYESLLERDRLTMPPKSAAAPPEPQPPRRRLRSIPGGYDIDRWPICVPIGPDETVPSWLMRAALRYEITPRALLAMAGADERIDRPGQFAAVVSRHADKLAHALGCPPDELRTAVQRIHPNTALSDYAKPPLGEPDQIVRERRSSAATAPTRKTSAGPKFLSFTRRSEPTAPTK